MDDSIRYWVLVVYVLHSIHHLDQLFHTHQLDISLILRERNTSHDAGYLSCNLDRDIAYHRHGIDRYQHLEQIYHIH